MQALVILNSSNKAKIGVASSNSGNEVYALFEEVLLASRARKVDEVEESICNTNTILNIRDISLNKDNISVSLFGFTIENKASVVKVSD